MDQHPIPRNISSFEFHLIGDMTLRQFVYLVIGFFSGFLVYKILPLPTIISIPVAGVFVFIGIAFAFLPISQRPLDKWLMAFIKSILSPTQYVWKKQNSLSAYLTSPSVVAKKSKVKPENHIKAHHDAKEKLDKYLQSLPAQPHETLNLREKKYVDVMLSLFDSTPTPEPASQPVSPPVPSPAKKSTPQTQNEAGKSVYKSIPKSPLDNIKAQDAPSPQSGNGAKLEKSQIDQKIKPVQPVFLKKEEAKDKTEAPVSTESQQSSSDYKKPQIQPYPKTETIDIKDQISAYKKQTEDDDVVKKLKQLEKEREHLLKEIESLKKEKSAPSPEIVKPELEKDKEPTIKAVTPKRAVDKIGLPTIDDTPNIIVGVIKDPEEKILPNVIVTVKDKDNMPLRALKTNKLGQFVTATPLANGTYFLEIEDPLSRYAFDIAKVTLSGKVFPPIEIIAKGEKEITRERLEKALFGNVGGNV